MINYIQWLLEEDAETPPEEHPPALVPSVPSKRRRGSGLPGIAPKKAEPAGGGRPYPEEIRATPGTDGSLLGEEGGRGEAELARRLGRNRQSWEIPAALSGIAAGAEASDGAKGREVLGLYTALRKTGRAERLLASAGVAATPVVVNEAPSPSAEAFGPLELDRCFEREARRYDNGFSLL